MPDKEYKINIDPRILELLGLSLYKENYHFSGLSTLLSAMHTDGTTFALNAFFMHFGYLPENDNIRYTISEAARIEILKCLAKLNHERWEEEQKISQSPISK